MRFPHRFHHPSAVGIQRSLNGCVPHEFLLHGERLAVVAQPRPIGMTKRMPAARPYAGFDRVRSQRICAACSTACRVSLLPCKAMRTQNPNRPRIRFFASTRKSPPPALDRAAVALPSGQPSAVQPTRRVLSSHRQPSRNKRNNTSATRIAA
jgi:hypothetical protein